MAVPDVQTMIRPALVVLNDGVSHSVRYIRDALAFELDVTDADMDVLLPSGKQTAYANRVGWVLVYLGRAGLVSREGRGRYAITPAGVDALDRYPDRIDLAALRAYPSFAEFRNRPVHAVTGASDGARYPDTGPFAGAALNGAGSNGNGAYGHQANGYNGANGYGSNGYAHPSPVTIPEPRTFAPIAPPRHASTPAPQPQHANSSASGDIPSYAQQPAATHTPHPAPDYAPQPAPPHVQHAHAPTPHTHGPAANDVPSYARQPRPTAPHAQQYAAPGYAPQPSYDAADAHACACGHGTAYASAPSEPTAADPSPRQQPWAFLTCMALIPLRVVDHTGRVARDIIDAVETCTHR